MRGFGINVDQLSERNRLIVNNYDRVYIVDGKVDVPSIIQTFSKVSMKYARMGLEGMRAAAEMSCFFKHGKVQDLLRYEEALHRKLEFPAEGVCAYNIFDLIEAGELHTIMQLAKVHSPVIFAGPKQSLLVEPERLQPQQIERAKWKYVYSLSFKTDLLLQLPRLTVVASKRFVGDMGLLPLTLEFPPSEETKGTSG